MTSVRMRALRPPFQRPNRDGWYLDYFLPSGKRERPCFPKRELAWKRWREVKRLKLQTRITQSLNQSPARKDALIPAFLDEFVAHKSKEVSPAWLQIYRTWGNNFVKFLKQHYPEIRYISQITRKSVDDYITWLKDGGLGHPLKQETLNKNLFFVKSLLYRAVDWSYLEFNPAARIKKIPVTDARPPRELTKEEFRGIIAKAEEPFKTLFLAYVGTGLRKTALLNLKWEDLDLRNKIVRSWSLPGRLTKTRKSQAIPMPSWLVPVLQKNLARDDEYPFRKRNGGVYQNNELNQRLRGAARRAGVKDWKNLHLHDLRHTYGRWLIESGVDVRAVQELYGHNSIDTTFLYTKPSNSYLHEAVERLAL